MTGLKIIVWNTRTQVVNMMKPYIAEALPAYAL